jgi:hypothetical protein
MLHFEVTLLNKRDFSGKRVMVEAHDADHAFKKALQTQRFPGLWSTLTAKPEANTTFRSKFQHKGVRYNR